VVGEAEERALAPPPAPRDPSSGAAETAIPKSNTRGRQDELRTRARQRKVVSVHVSVSMGVFVCLFLYMYVQVRGCLGGDVFGTTCQMYPRTDTPSGFLRRAMLA
jgi:hypothetical protein